MGPPKVLEQEGRCPGPAWEPAHRGVRRSWGGGGDEAPRSFSSSRSLGCGRQSQGQGIAARAEGVAVDMEEGGHRGSPVPWAPPHCLGNWGLGSFQDLVASKHCPLLGKLSITPDDVGRRSLNSQRTSRDIPGIQGPEGFLSCPCSLSLLDGALSPFEAVCLPPFLLLWGLGAGSQDSWAVRAWGH